MNAENKSLRALIVEDSPDDAVLLLDALQGGGFSVIHERVDCPRHLEEQLREKPWDVILCDHNLPGFDAPHALGIVRRHDEELPFIIVSGSISDDLAAGTMKNGAADFIPKSNLSRLIPAIERELRESANRQALRQAHEKLDHMLYYDPFTGLPNRDGFISRLRIHMDNSQQGRAVLSLELCRFKQIMKALGADVGRQLLRATAGRLARHGVVARSGEDCFALLVNGIDDAEQAEQFAQTLIESFWAPFQIEEQELFICCRLGISLYPQHGQEPEELLSHAETAMICDQGEGRGSYTLYGKSLDTHRQERLELEKALYRAVRNQEFELYYQPQLDLNKRTIVGVEALLRWNRPDHGMVSPARFIPMLEETGLIIPVGEWVLRTACQTHREWQQRGIPPVWMAVNLSAIQFRQPGLVELVKCTLAETGMAATSLELEITESVAIFNEQETIHTLRELGAIGVKLAIDDFGTGYSSLNSLKRFPFGKLKIDQSFVRDISRDANGESMVKAILDMAESLGLAVIAEGVETLEQADFLQKCGCHEIQGYYFSRPIPAGDMAALLEAHHREATSCKPDRCEMDTGTRHAP
ncbi:MAG: GGDEF domain-containing response regulator [Sulfuricella sp.]|nr:GGDEF domain-containing response regulator [Sulfuricella sp.]